MHGIKLSRLGFVCLAGVLSAIALSVGYYQGAPLHAGDKAPAFNALSTDSKTYTVATITRNKPAILYFIKEGCPVNKKAAPFLAKIASQYGLGANIYGVYNGDVKRARDWAAKFKATFPILADPEYKIIDSYKAPYSPFMIIVGKDGKIASVIFGAGPKDLPIINQLAAKNAGKKLTAIDFKGAPPGGGCSF